MTAGVTADVTAGVTADVTAGVTYRILHQNTLLPPLMGLTSTTLHHTPRQPLVRIADRDLPPPPPPSLLLPLPNPSCTLPLPLCLIHVDTPRAPPVLTGHAACLPPY